MWSIAHLALGVGTGCARFTDRMGRAVVVAGGGLGLLGLGLLLLGYLLLGYLLLGYLLLGYLLLGYLLLGYLLLGYLMLTHQLLVWEWLLLVKLVLACLLLGPDVSRLVNMWLMHWCLRMECETRLWSVGLLKMSLLVLLSLLVVHELLV